MEKSIESIWKEGFLNQETLAVPKINALYDLKSISLAEKYKRMFNKNIKYIFIGSFFVLFSSLLVGMPYMGIPMFIMLNLMALVDKNLAKKLEKLDKQKSCYQYLKGLNGWMSLKTKVNIRMAQILYPVTFLSMFMGFWFLVIKERTVGSLVTDKIGELLPEGSTIFGFPAILLGAILLIAAILIIIAERLYRWDLNLIYGDVLNKLDELLTDMEELRS